MSQPEAKPRTRIRPSLDVKEPPMYKVIYINDSQTSMGFVIDSLIEYFDNWK